MSDDPPKPKAKEPLLTQDHSKRGRRFVTVLDPSEQRITLLEPWEHAVLVLCDGSRDAATIADLLSEGVEDEPVTPESVGRCLQGLERQGLLASAEPDRAILIAPGARTLAGIQQAYREWHKDPVKTGQILSGLLVPFPVADEALPVGLEPTVALSEDRSERSVGVGTTFVVGEDEQRDGEGRSLRSVFKDKDQSDEPTAVGSLASAEDEGEVKNVEELLAMVDSDLSGDVEATDAQPVPPPPPVGKPIGGTAEIPGPKKKARRPAPRPPVEAQERRRRSTFQRALVPEAALNPTMVGVPVDDRDEPMIISPARPSSRAGDRVGATIGPTPSHEAPNVAPRKPRARVNSTITSGALVSDSQEFEPPDVIAQREKGKKRPESEPSSVQLGTDIDEIDDDDALDERTEESLPKVT